MEIRAIIPARGGSKRLPQKNIMKFADKPLICYSIMQAFLSEKIESVVVTTEDDKIEECVRLFYKENYKNKPLSIINRPEYLSTDDASVIDVIRHAVCKTSFAFQDYLIVMLYPTYPLRSIEIINSIIDYALSIGHGNFITIKPGDKTLYWNVLQDDNGKIKKVIPNQYYRLQDMPEVYRMAGAVHAFFKSELKNMDKNGISEDMYGYLVTDADSLIEVDDENSFRLGERIMRKQIRVAKRCYQFLESKRWQTFYS